MRILGYAGLLCVLTVGLFAQSAAANPRTASLDPLDIAGDSLYANELAESDLLLMLNKTLALETAAPAGQKRQYRIAQALIFRAQFHQQRQRPKDAENDLDQAEKMVLAGGEPSDAWGLQVLADIRSRLMGFRGLGYIIANSGSINDLALKSLQLDPSNVVSAIIVAYGKIKAPGLFGGNPELGIQMLTNVIARPDIQPTYRFYALLGVAEGWKKQNDPAQRQRTLESARLIYPANPDLQKALKE